MDILKEVMIIALFILQFIVLFQLLYINHKRYKEDKKFWAKQDEISNEFLKNAKSLCEGDVASEQEDTDKE